MLLLSKFGSFGNGMEIATFPFTVYLLICLRPAPAKWRQVNVSLLRVGL